MLTQGAAESRPAATRYAVLGGAQVLTSGPYVLRGAAEPNPAFMVGVGAVRPAPSTLPSAPNCPDASQDLVGGGKLVVGCGDDAELYTLPSGPWRGVSLANDCALQTEAGGECAVTGIGRYWLRFTLSCYHCDTVSYFQNLASGVVEGSRPNPHVVPDLNLPQLYRRLCSPISTLPGAAVEFLGETIVQVTPRNTLLVQKCGHKTPSVRIHAATFVAVRADLVLWGATNGLDGVCLLSGRHLFLTLPRDAADVNSVDLSAQDVLVAGVGFRNRAHIWATPRPRC
jgi:hypothetical protein